MRRPHRGCRLIFAGFALAMGARGVQASAEQAVARAAPTDRGDAVEAEPPSEMEPAPGDGSGAAQPRVEAGVLHSDAHGFRFPVPEGWALEEGAGADQMTLRARACGECLIKILVFPGRAVPVEETARVLREEASSGEGVEVLGEETTKIAREAAFTILKEGPQDPPSQGAKADEGDGAAGPSDGGGGRVVTRYVTFNHGRDKYYVMAHGPRERFGAIDAALDRMLRKFRFVR